MVATRVVIAFLMICTVITANGQPQPSCCRDYDVGGCDPTDPDDQERCETFCKAGCPTGTGACVGRGEDPHKKITFCQCGPANPPGTCP